MLRDPELENMFGHYMDLGTKPKIPLGWSLNDEDQLASYVHSGRINYEQSHAGLVQRIRPAWHKDPIINGYSLMVYFERQAIVAAHLLDLWYANQELISPLYSPFTIFAWTIFRDEKGKQCLRCLFKNGKRWYYGHKRLEQHFLENDYFLTYDRSS